MRLIQGGAANPRSHSSEAGPRCGQRVVQVFLDPLLLSVVVQEFLDHLDPRNHRKLYIYIYGFLDAAKVWSKNSWTVKDRDGSKKSWTTAERRRGRWREEAEKRRNPRRGGGREEEGAVEGGGGYGAPVEEGGQEEE